MLSIIVPCYNEDCKVIETYHKINQCFKNFEIEIIFVDDGSTDDTKHYLAQCKLNYISYKQNRGKGYAVRRGLLKARYKAILILDCDLSVRPDEYMILKDINKNFKIPLALIGRRTQVKKQPLKRLIAGKCWQMLVRLMFWWPYKDTQCPYKVLYQLPKRYIRELKIDGFAYDVELITMLRRHKIHIIELPVAYYDDTDSKVTLLKAVRMAKDLIKIRIKALAD